MIPEIAKVLAEERQNEQIDALLQRCKDLIQLSYDEMQPYYAQWDRNDRIYRNEQVADDQDRKAAKRKEPTKFILPMTYQQVQTFVAFCYSVFTQRQYFYELSGSGAEDEKAAQTGMAILERDLQYNKFKSEGLTQLLTDVARFGLGVVKTWWTHDTTPVIEMVPVQAAPGAGGLGQPQVAPQMVEQVVEATKYLGNKIVVVNPYRFFPDPRLPLTRFQEGEFCASEDEFSLGDLQQLEQIGQVAGVEFIPKMTMEALGERRFTFIRKEVETIAKGDPRYVVITEMQVKLNPAQTEYAPGKVLDKRINREVKYLIWVANNNRIIRLEPLGYLHDEFTYDVAQYTNDQLRFINHGIAELISQLQDTATWFINARITNVRKIISNQLVVDPDAIEFQDLKDRSPVLRLKKRYAGTGIDTYIKQLDLRDVTTGHLNDVNFLNGWAKEATGINENLLGSYASGRRSALEARSVNSNAAARLLLVARGIWEACLNPMGKKLISNLRQGLDLPTLTAVIGLSKVQGDPQAAQSFLMVNKAQLVGNYDFLPFDGTLPSQRGGTAMVLQELLLGMSKDPRLVALFQYDPKLLLDEILALRDVRNVERFRLTPERLGQLVAMAQPAGNPGNPQRAGQPRPANPGSGQAGPNV